MPGENSVSRWLDGLREGNDADVQRLWDRYFQRLVNLASARLPGHARRVTDEEDVALSAFHSFCDRVGRGQFPQLADRDDLWRILVTITVRKVAESRAAPDAAQARRRRGARPVGQWWVTTRSTQGMTRVLSSREPTPEVGRPVRRGLRTPARQARGRRHSDRSPCEDSRATSREEIAAELGTSVRTVDRKLILIRLMWQEELSP